MTTRDRRSCRRARALIEHRFDGALGLDDEFRLEEHVATCPACRRIFERDGELLEALQALPAPPVERLDVERNVAAVRATITERFGAPSSPRPARRRRWLPPTLAAAGVAAAVWIVVAVTGDRPQRPDRSGAPGTPDAAAVAAKVAVTDDLTPPAPAPSVGPAVPPPVPFDVTALGPSEVDGVALAARRTEVRSALVDAAAEITWSTPGATPDPAAVTAFVRDLDARLAPLAARGWPTLRIVAGLAEDEEPELARAVLRYLGRRGGAEVIGEVVDAMDRDELASAAVHALADAGAAGVDGLARAVWRPALSRTVAGRVRGWVEGEDRGLALAWLRATSSLAVRRRGPVWARPAAVDGSSAGGSLAGDSLAGGPQAGIADPTAEIVDVAALLGEPGAAVLLELVGRPPFGGDLLLAALRRTDGSADALVAAINAGNGEPEFLLRAVGALHPPESLPWVLERTRARSHRAAALRVLATFDGPDAAEALLELGRAARHLDADLLDAWRRAVDHDPERMVALARRPAARRERGRDRLLLEWLVLAQRPAAAPALAALARHEELAGEDRRAALFAIVELCDAPARGGGPDDESRDRLIEELAGSFRALRDGDERLGAAHLLALDALGGRAAAADALDFVGDRNRQRLLDLLPRDAASRTSTTTLFRLARELGPLLYTRDTDGPRSQP